MIERLEDGSYFRHKVTAFYQDHDGRNLTLQADPDSLYDIIHAAIVRMSNFGITPSDNPEEMKHKRLAALVKVAIKGLFMMYGDQILDAIFNSTDHPKPQKGDDLLDWYIDIFTRVAITHAMKNDLVLLGEYSGLDTIEVVAVNTRPVTQPEVIDAPAG